jgi:hypothetical protein
MQLRTQTRKGAQPLQRARFCSTSLAVRLFGEDLLEAEVDQPIENYAT